MGKLSFYKMQASGNDFILLDFSKSKAKRSKSFYANLAKKYCPRRHGIGADGLLVIEPSRKALFKMRIFNSDGSEAEMCGNGARCVGLWARIAANKTGIIDFDTVAGIIRAKVSACKKIKNEYCAAVRIKVTSPYGYKLDLPLQVLGRKIKVNFVNTGVPHAVVFVQGLEGIDVREIGRAIRFHKKFGAAGTNVNFVEVTGKNHITLRTYERGVEDETLACGTGTIASSIVYQLKFESSEPKEDIAIFAKTKSSEILKVSFDITKDKIDNVWLQGQAFLVYRGEIIL